MLPSYGKGRDAPGGRLSALIFGSNLTDVVITGNYRLDLFIFIFIFGINIFGFKQFLMNSICFGIVLGNNGTIDGQGSTWWKKFRAGELNVTRPYMIEIMYSDQIQISNLTLINSPSWFVHPIYSRFGHAPLTKFILSTYDHSTFY